MATYPINDENPPTGAGYRPGDIVVCPPGSVVPRWKYVGDEQWVPANVVEFVENEVTGGIDLSASGSSLSERRIYDYYIDSVYGDDANSGRSMSGAFRSCVPLAGITLPDGCRIGIAANSVLYSEISTASDGVTVEAYGNGSPPIFDCSDAVSGWTKTVGRTNVYEVVIALPGDVSVKGNVYADGVAIPQVASLALCDSTPGSVYISDWTAASATLYLHASASVDPAGDGREYRYTRRASGVFLSGNNCSVRGIRGRRNAHQGGSIRLTGASPVVYASYADDGCRHSMILGSGAVVSDVVFARGRNDLEAPGTANTLVVNQPTVVGTSYRTSKCVFDASGSPALTGPQNHGANANEMFESITHTDDVFIGLTQCIDVASTDTRLIRPKFISVALGALLSRGATSKVVVSDTVAGSTINRLFSAGASCTVESRNNNFSVPNLGSGFYRAESAANTVAVTVDGDTMYIQGATYPGIVFRHANGTLSLHNADIGPALCCPFDTFLQAGYSGGTVAVTANNNSYPYGADFIVNGVTHRTLEEWQAAGGQDSDSVTKQPIAPSFSDSFSRADENLEASASWTRIGGSAAQAAVRSGALAMIGTTQTLYAAPALSSADHYSRGTVAGVPTTANSFPLIVRGIDANNWIGARWNGTTYQVYKCVSGTLTQLGSSTAITPAVGDDVILASRGSRVWLYVNGVALVKRVDIAAAGLNSAVLTGVLPRSGSLTPAIDNFSCGLV